MDNRYQQPDAELEGFDPKAVNYNTAIRKGLYFFSKKKKTIL